MSDALPPIPFTYDGEAELWATISWMPAYSVSTHGRVRRDAPACGGNGSVRAPGGYLNGRSLPLGHRVVALSMNNKVKHRLVHRLVAEAFLPQPSADKDCVCHRDDDPSNNRLSNLFWGSRGDNSADKVAKGRQAKGERVAGSKLSNADVLEIRRLVSEGMRQREIADLFGCSQSNISMVASGITWGHAQ